MKILNNKKGSTLIVVLVLSGVALLITAGLLYMVTEATKVSGGGKNYISACQAARAGSDVMIQIINERAVPAGLGVTIVNNARLLGPAGKLDLATPNWGGFDSTINIDSSEPPATAATYDAWFDLGTNPTYRVYAKISGTAMGNSSLSGGGGIGGFLHAGGTTDGRLRGSGSTSSGEINPPSFPYIYSIELLAHRPRAGAADDPGARCRLSVLYQY